MTFSDAQIEAACHALWAQFNYTLPTLPYVIVGIVTDALIEAS